LSRAAAAPVQRLPLAAAGTRARLSFYPPDLRQAAHSHARAHVSIVIAGTVREVSGTRDEIAFPSTLTVRPYEITHHVEFGPQGALILSVDVDDAISTKPNSWNRCNLSAAQRTLLSWVLAQGGAREADADECIRDLMAGIEREHFRGSPPSWLIRARERLTSEPDVRIDELARAAGVHRAHFARAFQHWFKAPPSLFRRRALLCRALAELASGQSLAAAACNAGFADQSHLSRFMRATFGVTPRRLLRRA
jgi:AraC family transcriptional regulator